MSTYDLDGVQRVVFVCVGSDCRKAGADEVAHELKAEKKAEGLADRVHLIRTRCMGRCDDACNVIVAPELTWYAGVTPKVARRIVREHLRDGTPVPDHQSYVLHDGHLALRGSRKRGRRKS